MLKKIGYILTSNRRTLREKNDKAKDGRKANLDDRLFDIGKPLATETAFDSF
ncbi:MAG: hypothetical protein SPJ34_05800 [Candidatus Ornithospirochaeta sp.]|nr:hypothetical protein [Candidatus Ornithospirochaeta sp.]